KIIAIVAVIPSIGILVFCQQWKDNRIFLGGRKERVWYHITIIGAVITSRYKRHLIAIISYALRRMDIIIVIQIIICHPVHRSYTTISLPVIRITGDKVGIRVTKAESIFGSCRPEQYRHRICLKTDAKNHFLISIHLFIDIKDICIIRYQLVLSAVDDRLSKEDGFLVLLGRVHAP